MKPFPESFRKGLAQLDRLSVREKLLLTLMVLVVLISAVDLLLIAPWQLEQKQLRTQVSATQGEILQLETELTVARTRAAADPDAENRQRLVLLQRQVGELDAQLAALSLELIAPRDMPEVLRELLLRQDGLHLLSLENLPAEPLVTTEVAAKGAPVEAPNVYRHGLRLEFSGSYRQVLTYLQALEGLGKKMFWNSFELQAEDYPRSKVVLKVYTLSLKKEYIGV